MSWGLVDIKWESIKKGEYLEVEFEKEMKEENEKSRSRERKKIKEYRK